MSRESITYASNRRRSKQRLPFRDLELKSGGFVCRHCHNLVTTEPFASGVQNRNHCPYCLWSRCVDLYKAGDRLSACKEPMQPVGLTIKLTRKKYGGLQNGELMLVHQCTECGRVSINRIAADDDAGTLYAVFTTSLEYHRLLEARLANYGIHALSADDADLVATRLFGQRVQQFGSLN